MAPQSTSMILSGPPDQAVGGTRSLRFLPVGRLRKPRPDDRRARLVLHTVGLSSLHALEAGGLELTSKLPLGERPRDAAGPLGHIASCRLVHIGIGDDVGDREAAAWTEHPRGLPEDRRLVG